MEPTPDEALLTAYLDGEIVPADRQGLEKRLADEPELRQQLALLEETWNYIDLLEKEETDAEKVETTLKILAVSLSTKPAVSSSTTRWPPWFLAPIAGLLFFAVCYPFGMHSAKRNTFADPSFRQMMERLDMYLALMNEDDGLELLRYLSAHRVFLPETHHGVPLGATPVDINEFRPNLRVQTASAFHDFFRDVLSHSAVAEWGHWESEQIVWRNIQTYQLLSSEQASQMLQIHRAIEGAPRRAELLLTLQNYYHWLKSLQAYERMTLRQPKPLEEKASDIIGLKTRLDYLQLGHSAFMPAEIVDMEESQRLAEVLSVMPFNERDRLLNGDPLLMINEIKQRPFD